MKTHAESVVVTGLGVITPLGCDVPTMWSALLAGRSGVRLLADSWADRLPVRIAAQVDLDPALVNSARFRRMARCEQFAMLAALEAWRDAGEPPVPGERLGISIATGIGGLDGTLAAWDVLRARGWRALPPFTVPMTMPNGAAAWVGIELGARAGVHATVSACASGSEAIGYGIDMIRSGRADVVVVGGTEAPIIAMCIGSFAVAHALSLRNDEPERASRPFDKARDGFVLGEGAGVLVLESAEYAMRRGARVYATAAGVGYSSDAHHPTSPNPDGSGAALAIRRALADAHVTEDQVVHINAHATSTKAGDEAEARAIKCALGDYAAGVLVSASKSMTGHLLGGAGAIEAIAAICALNHRVAPPTINLTEPDDAVTAAGFRVTGRAEELPVGHGPVVALNNSFGFGGHNVVLAFVAA